jgi:hypothetical protein
MRFEGDQCIAELTGRYGIYLDTFSIIDLAKPSEAHDRFLSALQLRGTLLFSLSNAVEVGGLLGDSATRVTAFLSAVGPNWLPLELNVWKVAERELDDPTHMGPVSPWFMEAFVRERMRDLGLTDPRSFDGPFFDLGAVVRWSQLDRKGLCDQQEKMAQAVRSVVTQYRMSYDADATFLDRELPQIPFDPNRRATFVLMHLMRILVMEAKSHHFTRNDALDLCHAVPAVAYSSLATLDKTWKRRVASLPTPSRVARVFYQPELLELISELEGLVATEPITLRSRAASG